MFNKTLLMLAIPVLCVCNEPEQDSVNELVITELSYCRHLIFGIQMGHLDIDAGLDHLDYILDTAIHQLKED